MLLDQLLTVSLVTYDQNMRVIIHFNQFCKADISTAGNFAVEVLCANQS